MTNKHAPLELQPLALAVRARWILTNKAREHNYYNNYNNIIQQLLRSQQHSSRLREKSSHGLHGWTLILARAIRED